LSSEHNSLDALVEALLTDNGWLEYRLQIVQDELLNQGAQAAADASVVDKVTSAFLERDEALQKVREDLAAMQAVVAEWETELASARAQLHRATLEGAWSWQSQAKEKAKEVEQLRADLADKVALLTAMEEQLQQERSARQQAETRLEQECSALEEARATLERERMAGEEAQGQLQWVCAALEEEQATLKLWDQEITLLSGELVQEGVSYEELWQAGEEKDATILDLQRAAETACAALETEKKQVDGELPFLPFTCWLGSFGIRSQLGLRLGFQAYGRFSGTHRPRRRPTRRPTTLFSRSWRSCRPPHSRRARGLRKARRRPGAPWRHY
jgi:hypothetical protein